MTDIKETKRQIRFLRKLKKDMHKGTQDRRDINKKIRDLKKQLIPITEPQTETKQKLIDSIIALKPYYIGTIDLRQYTEAQLQKHLDNIRRKI
jgi:hypothetical protein